MFPFFTKLYFANSGLVNAILVSYYLLCSTIISYIYYIYISKFSTIHSFTVAMPEFCYFIICIVLWCTKEQVSFFTTSRCVAFVQNIKAGRYAAVFSRPGVPMGPSDFFINTETSIPTISYRRAGIQKTPVKLPFNPPQKGGFWVVFLTWCVVSGHPKIYHGWA